MALEIKEYVGNKPKQVKDGKKEGKKKDKSKK